VTKNNPYLSAVATPVPQSEPENSRQVKNNAGGYTFQVSDKDRLERFLVLGTTGGTYYVGEKDLTKQNLSFLVDLIKRDPSLYIDRVRDISLDGRAPKNSPAIFALALAFKHGDGEMKKFAREMAFPSVVRTSTHLFEFAQYMDALKGWGPAKRKAVASWYLDMAPDNLAYQAVKYRQRNGWTHRDLFRLSHPKDGFRTFVGTQRLPEPSVGSFADPVS
jgi:60 kDa SS-A/Ro ribonucleoprotein